MSGDIIELLQKHQADQQRAADSLQSELDEEPDLREYAERERAILEQLRPLQEQLEIIRQRAQDRASREYLRDVARNAAAWLGGQVQAAAARRTPADAAEALASSGLPMRARPHPDPLATSAWGAEDQGAATTGATALPTRHDGSVAAPHRPAPPRNEDR